MAACRPGLPGVSLDGRCRRRACGGWARGRDRGTVQTGMLEDAHFDQASQVAQVVRHLRPAQRGRYGIRDESRLAKLPSAEAATWRALFADVKKLIDRSLKL